MLRVRDEFDYGPPRGRRLCCSSNDVTELFNSTYDDFLYSVKTNSAHVLQPYRPDRTDISYCLRTGRHNTTMVNKNQISK